MPTIRDESIVKMQRKIRKRGYMRQFMQLYRGKEKEEVEKLKREIEQLEKELASRLHGKKNQPVSELSWKDVAIAMQQMNNDGILEQHNLLSETHDASSMMHDLQGWVASFNHPSKSPNPQQQTWRDVSLLAHPRSRRLGKEWITQHMYHNANRIFSLQECPPAYYSIIDNTWDIDFSGHCYYVLERGHVDWNLPLDNVRSMFRNHMCSMFTLDAFCPPTTQTLTETTENTVLHQLVPDDTGGGEQNISQYVNYLGGEFNEDERTVIVVTQIQDDELVQKNTKLPQRSRMTWVELHRESPTRTRGRYVSIVSQQFTRDGYVSMEEEARGWGYDLSQIPEWEQEGLFLQLHRARNVALKSSRQQWYSALIAEEIVQSSTPVKDEL